MSKRYIGNDLGPWPGAAVCSHGDEIGVGCVGFGRTDGDVVTLTIYDDSGLPVGGLAYIGDGRGRGYSRQFCGTSGRMPAVSGWLLTVHLRPQSGLSLACPVQGSAVATNGRVQATFTAAG